MTPPWLLSPKKAEPIYAKVRREIRELERLIIAKFGRKALRGKQ